MTEEERYKLNLAYENLHKHKNLKELNEYTYSDSNNSTFFVMKITDNGTTITNTYYKNYWGVDVSVIKTDNIYTISFPSTLTMSYFPHISSSSLYPIVAVLQSYNNNSVVIKTMDLSGKLGTNYNYGQAEFYLILEAI